jgi:hypothetical protein
MFGGKEEGMRQTSWNMNSGKSSHLLSMVSTGREKRKRPDYWK